MQAKKDLSNAVKMRLEEPGMTFEKLAKELNVKKTSLYRAKKGDWIRPSPAIKNISGLLGVSLSEAVQPEKCTPILSVIKEVWDGTDQHARALANIIREVNRISYLNKS